jgi:hypothetical protein
MPSMEVVTQEVRHGEHELCKAFDKGVRPDVSDVVKQVFDHRAARLKATELKREVTRAVGSAKAAAPGQRRKPDASMDVLNPDVENEVICACPKAGIPAPPREAGPTLLAGEILDPGTQ